MSKFLECPQCGCSDWIPQGVVLACNPPSIPYDCKKCGYTHNYRPDFIHGQAVKIPDNRYLLKKHSKGVTGNDDD